MFTDVSIDLETLGTATGSVITQIGLCAFNAQGYDGGSSATLIRVDPQSAIDAGFTVSWATISWWLQQSESARLSMASCEGRSIRLALHDMENWFSQWCVPDFRVWGHGATFDIGLLENALTRLGLPIPWSYRNVRDLRTLAALAPEVEKPAPHVEHTAMEDAVAQAHRIQNLYRAVKRESWFIASAVEKHGSSATILMDTTSTPEVDCTAQGYVSKPSGLSG